MNVNNGKISNVFNMGQYAYLILLLTIFPLIFFYCSNEKIEANEHVLFTNKKEGKKLIIKDTKEGFFDDIQLNDIELQTGKEFDSRESGLDFYKESLKGSVLDFDGNDKNKINRIFNHIDGLLNKINPGIIQGKINLIKIKPNHFGKSVFYTRENSIVIPSDMLDRFNEGLFMDIMIHEIFHIYSRYQKEKKKKLYSTIHFTNKPNGIQNPKINIPLRIKENMILNPDGLDNKWFILCNTPKGEQWIFPLLQYEQNESKRYFDNFELRFFYCHFNANEIGINENDFFTEEQLPDLYNKITQNTNYILHPDEILAENFVLAVRSQENPKILDGLSNDGKKLIEDIISILKEK